MAAARRFGGDGTSEEGSAPTTKAAATAAEVGLSFAPVADKARERSFSQKIKKN